MATNNENGVGVRGRRSRARVGGRGRGWRWGIFPFRYLSSTARPSTSPFCLGVAVVSDPRVDGRTFSATTRTAVAAVESAS